MCLFVENVRLKAEVYICTWHCNLNKERMRNVFIIEAKLGIVSPLLYTNTGSTFRKWQAVTVKDL